MTAASLTLLLCLSSAGVGLAVPATLTFDPQRPEYATEVSASITADTTWNLAGSPYHVTGQLAVRAAATLTIEPGVDVRFEQDGQLIVEGNLVADGTADRPIRFLGNQTGPGSWRGIALQSSTTVPAEGRFVYVTIAGGGVAGDFRGGLYVYAANLEMRNSEVRDSAGDGIVLDSGSMTVTDTRLTGNAGLPLHARSLDAGSKDPVLRDLTIDGNGVNAIAIDGGTITDDSVWENVGAPYRLRGQILVAAPAILTVEPGVEVQFERDGELYVEGGLIGLGSVPLPIRFVGIEDIVGSWRGIRLRGTGSEPATASLRQVTIANAGSGGRAAIDVSNGRLSFIDGRVTNLAAGGIVFTGGPVSGIVEGSALTNIGGVGVGNSTRNLVVAINNWWGSETGPTTRDACNAGTGTPVEGLVRYGPWLRSADERPDPLAPLEAPLVTLSPQRWYAPADGKTRVWVDVTLLDPRGTPIPGATVNLISSLGSVTSGGITDAAGHTLAYLTSIEMGDAEIVASLSPAERCDQAASTTATVTFTDDDDGLLVGMKAPYLFDAISISPEPITRGVPTTISARLSNPNDHSITVEASFEFVNSGIGLAFGPVGQAQTKEIPAGGEQVFETAWTPVVSGHYCIQVQYRIVGGTGALPEIGPVAVAGLPGFPAQVGAYQGAGSGSGQRNLNVYGGGLGPGGQPGGGGGKPPLDKAQNAGDAVGKMGKFAGGATFVPRLAVGALTGWQFKKAAEISKGLGGDPPRLDFKIIAEPVRATLPTLPRAAGVSDELYAAQVALAEAMAEVVALGDAAVISFDRYGGAAAASNLEWAAVQASSLLHYRKLLGQAAIVAADRMAALRSVLEREGSADVGLTPQEVADALAAIQADGFSQEQVDAAHALGLTDDAIEAARQDLLSSRPEDIAGPLGVKLADAEVAFREMGDYLMAPVNFADEPGREAFNDQMLLVGSPGTESNLARIYDHHSTIQVGNPLDHETTVELRVRRITMPMEWQVDLSPSSVTLAPGQVATVEVSISATTPWLQGTRIEVAIEGVAEGQLLGGVVVALVVPASVAFGVVPGGQPPLLIIAVAALVVVLLILVMGMLFRRRRRLGPPRPAGLAAG